MSPTADTNHVLSTLVRAVLAGELTGRDFVEARTENVRASWQWVLRELDRGPTDPNLVQVVRRLNVVDPELPHGRFLLGMALSKVGRTDEARATFAEHAALRPQVLPEQTRSMLRLLA